MKTRFKPWTDDERRMVKVQRDRGIPWSRMILPEGRTRGACEQELYKVRRWEAAGARLGVAKQRAVMAAQNVPAAPAPGPVARSSAYSSTHLVDADMRSRIALQGLTAGFFGDPLPGRSALDQKRAGSE